MPRRLSSCSVGSEKTAEGVISGAVRSALSTAVCSIIDRACKKDYTMRKICQQGSSDLVLCLGGGVTFMGGEFK